MGITTIIGARLVNAKNNGVGFERTATMERLSLCIPREDLGSQGIHPALTDAKILSVYDSKYADNYLRLALGAETVTSFDYSDYQDAGVVYRRKTIMPSHSLI